MRINVSVDFQSDRLGTMIILYGKNVAGKTEFGRQNCIILWFFSFFFFITHTPRPRLTQYTALLYCIIIINKSSLHATNQPSFCVHYSFTRPSKYRCVLTRRRNKRASRRTFGRVDGGTRVIRGVLIIFFK